MGLSLVTAPTAEPVTLAEARTQCRLDHTLHDAQLAMLMLAAREWGQGYTGRVFMSQTWDYTLHAFPSRIELPLAPAQSITSITYVDAAGATQTLSSAAYEADTKSVVPVIRCKEGYSWPSTARVYNAVTVRFVAGYPTGHPDLMLVRAALLLHIQAHYDCDERDMKLLLERAGSTLWPLKITSF